jgi:hypothetical protein
MPPLVPSTNASGAQAKGVTTAAYKLASRDRTQGTTLG